VEKLPVTVLSRCQRFDLRRISAPMLATHFAGICEMEDVAAEDEALAMIAAAAEGSVRDGLSILDQAIAHADLDSDGRVTADKVRDMLGLADKSARRRLFAALLGGDGKMLLDLVEQLFALGVEPVGLLRAVMNLTHQVTVTQVSGHCLDAASAEERAAIEEWARSLTPGQLHRLWQLLLKGHDEVRIAPDPLVAAQMALLRVMHASELPDPGKLARELEGMLARTPAAVSSPASGGGTALEAAAPIAPPAPSRDWAGLVDLVERAGSLRVAQVMRDWVRVISLANESLTFALAPGYSGDPAADLRDALSKATGARWQVELASGDGAPTLRETEDAHRAAAEAAMRQSPVVAAALAAFPDAEFVSEEDDSGREGRSRWRDRA